MILLELQSDKGILIVRPFEPLTKEDFAAISQKADTHIESHGGLNGLMLCFERFPGWKNLKGMWSHFQFVRNHHRKINKVAFVTNTKIVKLVIRIAKLFVHPDARYFKFDQEESAMRWIGAS
jgi:hypothetical protein